MRKVFFIFYFFIFGTAFAHAQNESDFVRIQLIGINDFHGNLEPPTGSLGTINGISAGGIEYLATHIKNLKENQRHSLILSAGDLFGASPLLSALFDDKPTIEAMNLLGLDINAIGNHEFDKGWEKMQKLILGECSGKMCGEKDKFGGAQFEMLASNVIIDKTGKTLFPSYSVRQFGAVKIAIVGVVLKDAPNVIAKDSIEGLTFKDEAQTVNALIPELKSQGVSTIILLIHEGGFNAGDYNGCKGISGPIVNIVQKLDDEVGVVLSGHTHQAYNCNINDKIVTSAASYGRLVTEIFIDVDVESGQLIRSAADNIVVTRTVKKDIEQSALIKKYQSMAAPITQKIVGTIQESFTKQVNRAGESTLGKMIADAQLETTNKLSKQESSVAFVNPGGIRTDIVYASSSNNEGDGKVNFGEVYAVQPFGNSIISMMLSGQQIVDILEQQFVGCGASKKRVLQVSKGFSYQYDERGPACHKVIPSSIFINQKALVLEENYRVCANSFLADGGDGFSGFNKGWDKTIGVLDIDALANYLESHPNLSTQQQGSRVSVVEH
ncbi:MAG: bifunctional metallophosphatase/5'-nucleotidase [Myxococcales bacterium]|nr:bifunctional metallophosphatase/5'-nucleotidase [Myxococcales bacterium]USN49923.1 MAG: bifunctional metallophosphatase/5'-nucleotidase [Myxococcales bacterium]